VSADTLFLFDVDGTLVQGATRAHAEALYAALAEVHGEQVANVPSPISPAGRTDGEIARVILLAAGISADRIDERTDEVRAVCCREYTRRCPPDLSDTVLPGVASLLEWLASRGGARLALLTGNYEPVARLKLARAGLGRWFASGQGAFGSDAEDRAALPAIARRRAGTTGAPFPRDRTIVIGDTPLDIACARADRVRCVAVATGRFGVSELENADAVARDAAELRGLLPALLSAA